ncbi:MAG: c-type cytochrome [Thermoanaerobaculia bacterium]
MKRAATMGFVLCAIVGGLAIAAVTSFLLQGISARKAPARVEVRMARAARHLLIPRRAQALQNPVPADSETVASGRAHFADHCFPCHGNDGKGDTLYGRRMFPRAPDMSAAATQSLSDGELFWIIENGVRLTGMPGFGDDDPANDSESWELVHFIRSLPRLKPEELAEMERLNPSVSRVDVEKEREEEQFLAGEDVPPAPPAQSGH